MQEHNSKGLGMGQGNFLGTSVRAFQVLEKGEGKKRGFQRLTAIISQTFILVWPKISAPYTVSHRVFAIPLHT